MEATPGILHQPQVELDQVLGDQAEGDIGLQEDRVLRPALQDDERVAILGGHAGTVARRRDGLGEIDHQRDLLLVEMRRRR